MPSQFPQRWRLVSKGPSEATQSALPTRIYDTNNNLITELFSDEKREIVPLEEIPQHLINAVLTREDQKFYNHIGFSLKGLTRATFGYIIGRFLGGGSTLTMQVAGNKYDDRTDISVRRKLVEIWYSLQLEKHYSKNEILEFYLNEMPFGSGKP